MPALAALVPALLLIGGALLFLLPLPLLARYRRFVPLIANVFAVISLLVLAVGAREPVTLFEPSDILPALTLTLQWNNGFALPLGLVLLFCLSARMLMGLEYDPRLQTAGTLVVEAGALLLLAADNWTTVTAAWLVVELGLLAIPIAKGEPRERVARAFAWNLAALVAWLTGGMIAANEASSLRLDEATLQGTAALLIFLACWIRSGLYPFQAAAPASADTFGVRVGVPFLLGGYLLTRLLAQLQGSVTLLSEMQLVVLLAFGISALLVVGQPHGADAFDWVLRAFAAPLLLLPFFFTSEVAPAFAIWLAIGAFALASLIGLAWLWRAQPPRVPLTALVWIAALCVTAALPLTPAFTTRVGMLAASYATGFLALWLLLVAAMALILIPLWREIFASRDVAPKAPTIFEYTALACVLLPTLSVAVLPMFFASPVSDAADTALKLFAQAIMPTGSQWGAWIFLIAGLVVPLLASFELARRWERYASFLPTRVSAILDLSGLSRAFDLLYRFVRALLQRTLSILEQPPIAWLIFLAIWVAVWLRGLGT